MKKSQKKLALKLNRNKFPHDIHRYLNSDISIAYEKKRPQIKQLLKSWYLDSFQKNNRWNKRLINSLAKEYTNTEINELSRGFQSLFDIDRKYNQTFLRYLAEYNNQIEAEKSGLRNLRLKVDQETFKEIIQYFGDLKRAGKIKNANHEIAKVLKRTLEPDVTFESPTILDRLKNKKGYY